MMGTKNESAIIEAAARILGRNPDHLETLNALGVYYFQTKKFGLAKIFFKRALNQNKEEPAIYNNLGIVYLAEGDLKLAIDSFKKSLAARSGYSVGATNLSSIYLKYLDYKRSISPLEDAYRSIRSDLRRGTNDSVEIANNYAVALMGINENDKARKIFEEISSAGVRNPVPYLNQAILLVEVLKKKSDALRVLSKLKFMTNDSTVLRKVAELEKKLE